MNMVKEFGSVVSPQVLKSLASESGAVRTCFLQFLCLNDKDLLQLYVKATSNLHKNVAHYSKLALEEAQSVQREKEA